MPKKRKAPPPVTRVFSAQCHRLDGCVLVAGHRGACKLGAMEEEDYEVESVLDERRIKGGKLVENRHFAEAATELEPFLPPRFACAPFRYERDGALEARTARWTECFNNASLGPKLMDNATRQDELWRRVNLRAGTKPLQAELTRAAATA